MALRVISILVKLLIGLFENINRSFKLSMKFTDVIPVLRHCQQVKRLKVMHLNVRTKKDC